MLPPGGSACEFVVVWRVAGTQFDVDAFLQAYPGIAAESVWRKGDVKLKKARSTSGFNKTVAITTDAGQAVEQAIMAIRHWRNAILGSQQSGAAAALDFGVFVDAPNRSVVNIRFQPSELREFAALGLKLEISTYVSLATDSDMD